MKIKILSILCLLVLLLGMGPLTLAQEAEPAAQEEADSTTATEEEATEAAEEEGVEAFFATTTVTATGSEVSTFDIATPVIVIGAEEIEQRMPENATDLLRAEPGVDVNGVGPNQARPIIRGQRGHRVLFMENGLRMNNSRRQSDFGEIPGLVDVNSVETLEVVRGPASVLYGSDAIGGVLNLVTKAPSYRGEAAFGGSAALRYGSAAESTGIQVDADGRTETFGWRVGYTQRDADDYEAAAGDFGDIHLDNEETVVDTGIEDKSFTGYAGWLPSDSQEVFLLWNIYRADQTGFGNVDPSAYGGDEDFLIRILYPYQDFDRYTLGYRSSAMDSFFANSLDTKLYYQRNERELQNDIDINIGPIFPGAPDSSVEIDSLNFTDIETIGLRAEAIKAAGTRNLLTYGLEYWKDDSFNTDFSTTTTTIRIFPGFEFEDIANDDIANAPNADHQSFGIFVQDEIDILDNLDIIVGLRYTDVATKAKATPGWDTSGLDFDDDSVVGAINFVWAVKDYLNIVGSYGTAFRAPNIIERLFNGVTPEGSGYQVLNPDLKSEDSKNAEIGIKYQRWNAYFEAMYFDTEIDDGIVQAFLTDEEIAALPPDVQDEIEEAGGAFVVQQRNVDTLNYEGYELAFGYRHRTGVSVGANYTKIDSSRVDSNNLPIGDTLSKKANGWIRYNYPSGRFFVEYRLRHNGSEPSTVDPNEPPPPVGATIPAFTIHTLSGGVTLFETRRQRHSLNLVIDNLTDELYSEFSNASFFRPQPKRNFLVSYRWGF